MRDATGRSAPRRAAWMRPRQVLLLMAASLFLAGLLEQTADPGPWMLFVSSLLFALLQNFLPFYWYRLDSDLRDFPRSRWMNFGIVFMMPLAIPVYLLRSRARGKRLRALLRFAGCALALALAVGLGLFAGTLLPRTGPLQQPQKSIEPDTVTVRGAPATR